MAFKNKIILHNPSKIMRIQMIDEAPDYPGVTDRVWRATGNFHFVGNSPEYADETPDDMYHCNYTFNHINQFATEEELDAFGKLLGRVTGLCYLSFDKTDVANEKYFEYSKKALTYAEVYGAEN